MNKLGSGTHGNLEPYFWVIVCAFFTFEYAIFFIVGARQTLSFGIFSPFSSASRYGVLSPGMRRRRNSIPFVFKMAYRL